MMDKENLNVTSAASGLKDNRELSGEPQREISQEPLGQKQEALVRPMSQQIPAESPDTTNQQLVYASNMTNMDTD